MKIYTKKGDRGKTSLVGGQPVSKADLIIEALGSLDELNAHLGVLRDKISEPDLKEALKEIQKQIFSISAYIAACTGQKLGDDYKISSTHVSRLEKMIDVMQVGLEPLQNFILPGGAEDVSQCHLVRAVCRRTERSVVRIDSAVKVDDDILAYLNRLSDYLFVLARFLAKRAGSDETKWQIN